MIKNAFLDETLTKRFVVEVSVLTDNLVTYNISYQIVRNERLQCQATGLEMVVNQTFGKVDLDVKINSQPWQESIVPQKGELK